MADEASLSAAWGAIQRFVHEGDASANLSLYQQLQNSLGGEGWIPQPMMHTLAPRLLQYSLENYQSGSMVSSGILSFVTILNRIVCLKLLPEALARPLDRRPTGLHEMAGFYRDILLVSSPLMGDSYLHLPPLARRQIIACLGCLLVLLEEDIVATLRAQFMATLEAPSTSCYPLEDVFQVFLVVLDILSDDRLPIGPIRRATQRKRLQTQLEMLLFPIATPNENLLCLQAEAVAKGIEFLTIGIIADPQDLAEAFWQQLPSSTPWQWALYHQRAPDGRLAAIAQQLLCGALRSLSTVDPAAEQLIVSALTSVMSDTNMVNVVASCKVIASAMESTTESILLHCGPSSSIFSILSNAAEYLLGALAVPSDAKEETMKVVCEGVSVLVQSLTLTPLPAAEPTDDPEDFIELIESINRENGKKMATTRILHAYLCRAQRELGACLVAMTSSHHSPQRGEKEGEEKEENRAAIASYALEHIKPGKDGVGDFQVAFDDAVVAVFAAYERLYHLLGSLPREIAIENQTTTALAVIAASASESIRAISAAETHDLLEQATLLPLISARYVGNGKIDVWNEEQVHFFFQRLVDLLEFAVEADLARRPSILSTLASTLLDLLRQRFSSAMQTGSAREECIPRIMEVLWRCLVTVEGALPQRLCIARSLAQLMEEKLVHAVFSDTLRGVHKFDPRTQLDILSACSPDSSDSFRYLLRLLECISPTEEEALLDRASNRISQNVVSFAAASGVNLEGEYQDMIWSWYLLNTHHLRVIFQLSKPLSRPIRCAFRVAALRFYLDRFDGPDNISTEDLCCLLGKELCSDLAESSDRSSAEIMMSLIACLLHSSALFSLSSGLRRLRALLRCARALLESQSSLENLNQKNAEHFFLELLCSAVARFKETSAVHLAAELTRSADFRNGLNKEDAGEGSCEENEMMEGILEDMAVLGRCVHANNDTSSMPGCPAWIVSLTQAVDDRDRQERLRRAVFMNESPSFISQIQGVTVNF